MNVELNNTDITITILKANDHGNLVIYREGIPALALDGLGVFVQKGCTDTFAINSVKETGESLHIVSTADQMEMTATIFAEEGESRFIKFDVQLKNAGDVKKCGRVFMEFIVRDTGIPRWLIPSVFYKENRSATCQNKWYPRYDYYGGRMDDEPDSFTSDTWAFRSDRSSFPAVFCWTEHLTTALLTDESFSHGTSGLYFRGNEDAISIGLNFPFCETPVANIKFRDSFKPEYREMVIQPGATASFSFRIYLQAFDLHSYDKPIREIYWKTMDSSPLNPWMGIEEAADLTAYGLYNWHYKDEYHILYETIGFDNVVSCVAGEKDCRPHMHISWVSGVPYAFGLLKYGVKTGNEEYWLAGRNVIDKVAEGMAPGGMLWSQWTVEKGWDSGWNPKPNWSHSKTVSEAVLFLARAYEFELDQGRDHKKWRDIIQANLDYAVCIQREDGNFGSYYNALNGEVEEWDGCGGMLWIASLVEAYKLFDRKEYLESAQKAAAYYKKFILDEYIYGAPEDVHLSPTSEDTYNGVLAYVALYEADRNTEWLEMAKRSADLMMTFRWTYNVTFSGKTILALYDYRTRGGDSASPSNNHIHNYGLVCLPEMLKLYQYTGDRYYLKRTVDNFSCFLQFIAREDGDFNAKRGMVTEQWYYTDWWRPKGTLLALSHAWCIGMILNACMAVGESDVLPEIIEDMRK